METIDCKNVNSFTHSKKTKFVQRKIISLRKNEKWWWCALSKRWRVSQNAVLRLHYDCLFHRRMEFHFVDLVLVRWRSARIFHLKWQPHRTSPELPSPLHIPVAAPKFPPPQQIVVLAAGYRCCEWTELVF